MSEEKTILLFGDSISRGAYFDFDKKRFAFNKNCYFELLRDRLNAKLMNNSRAGGTLTASLESLNKLLEVEPYIVILAFGGNDSDLKWQEVIADPKETHIARTDHYVFFNTLKQTVEHLNYTGVMPVLMTLPPIDPEKYLDFISGYNEHNKNMILEHLGYASYIYSWHERYNAAILKTVEQTDARLIDVRSDFLFSPNYREYLCRDGIHPNDRGHELIANCIERYFEENESEIIKA